MTRPALVRPGPAGPGTGSSLRVLVVEDDPAVAEVLAETLRLAGFRPLVAGLGWQAVQLARRERPDLMLLDLMLPDVDGLAVCRTVREILPGLPVIVLTARDASRDRVAGLALADDYVVKPFATAEVLARIGAVLRRSGRPGDDRLRFADLEMDDAAHDVRRADRSIDLSPTEYRVLRFLLTHPHQVLSKAQIYEHVWRYPLTGDGNAVEKVMLQLRRKLDAGGPPLLHTVRGFGYALRR